MSTTLRQLATRCEAPLGTKVMPSFGRSRVCSAPLRAALRTGNAATPPSSPKEPDAVDALVGHNIRIQRHARRISQTALAERLGVTFQQVQKYANGVNRVGAGRLKRIAAVLGVPVTALLDGADGVRDERAPAGSALAMIAERQPYRLAAAYARIPDQGVRRAVVVLVEKLARRRGG